MIVAGGQIGSRDFYRDLIIDHDLIIGADKGADSIRSLGLVPHTVVGDLDSISAETLDWVKNNNLIIREFPADKDKTDMELAIEEAVASGATGLTLTGTWGGRIDQSLANVFLLRLALKQGIDCCIREEDGDIYIVDRRLIVSGAPGDTVSLLALEECAGVVLDGFKYKIRDGKLIPGSTLGISNILLGKQGAIELQSGLLLLIVARGTSVE
ncbi:MAG: thiamine diphosphokinase [Actinomycetota bacterium]|nr:thiamine diphosphokinase [Actinomycetota bacterium]